VNARVRAVEAQLNAGAKHLASLPQGSAEYREAESRFLVEAKAATAILTPDERRTLDNRDMLRAVSALQKAVLKMSGRIKALEARDAAPFRYRGVYEDGADYEPGDFITQDGTMWHCNAATRAKPPGPDWTLAVKRGRDGRDRR
jgi:hypothetical protein